MQRETIYYAVGDERKPGNPFGRSRLVIQVDGQATLDQYTQSGHSAWKGVVVPSALEKLWAGLEEGRFPYTPPHPWPAGATVRDLNIGGPRGPSAYFALHAVDHMPGYATVFDILDNAIRQLSENSVHRGRDDSEKIVDAIERIPA